MKKLKTILLLEGVLSFILAAILFYAAGFRNAVYIFSLPFDLVGKGLRMLSLGSKAGNTAAFFLYAALSLLPVFYMVYKGKRSKLAKEDLLLPVISAFSFYLFYEFINPGLMINRLPDLMADAAALPIIKLSLAIVFYTLLFSYLILRMLGHLSLPTPDSRLGFLCGRLEIIILVVSAIYTFALGYVMAFQVFLGFEKYAAENRTPINGFFILLSFVLKALPVIFSILTMLSFLQLLRSIALNHMQEEEIAAAAKLGAISRLAVYVTVISNIALNVLQFLYFRSLSDTSFELEISLIPLVIAFSAMILSGFFKETKDLHEDNEMII